MCGALVLSVLLAGCATTVAGSAAPAVTVLPLAPSPVPPSPVAGPTAATTSAVLTSPVVTTSVQPSATPAPSGTEQPGSSTLPSDPSTEILTVVSTPPASPAASSGRPTTTARTSVSRLTVPPSSSHHGTATVGRDGGVTVRVGTPKVAIEVYDEPLCPPCGEFARGAGVQIDKAVDAGDLAVTYRTLTFLDSISASGDYSTRASAALVCVATRAGRQPGLFQDYYGTLFDERNQPAENASKDLTDAQLAKLAAQVGAPESVLTCIRRGAAVDTAKEADITGEDLLAEVGGSGTPLVSSKGKIVDHNAAGWLDHLLG
jgi:serine/threonine-protein kinase